MRSLLPYKYSFNALLLRAIGALILSITFSRPVRVCEQPACRSSRQLQLNPGAAVPVLELHSRQSPWREAGIDPHRLGRHYRLDSALERMLRQTLGVVSIGEGESAAFPDLLFDVFNALSDLEEGVRFGFAGKDGVVEAMRADSKTASRHPTRFFPAHRADVVTLHIGRHLILGARPIKTLIQQCKWQFFQCFPV